METLQRLHNRGSVSTGYDIDNSCKFEADNAEKMTHTYDSAPTSQKKGTISIWFKRTEISSNIGIFQFGDDASGDYLAVRWGRDIYGSGETYRMRIGGSTNITLDGEGSIRDTSAWYHMVIAIDTTQATASNRFRVYRNGAEVSMSTDNRSSLTQNTDMAIGENGKDIMIGEGVYKYNGYIAEVNYVDGQQLTPSDFGKYDSDSGIWIPKKYTGTYGNNGFYLDFSNASNLGEDQSGNNHDFTLSNITSADQATDTPTNNFCTMNALDQTNGNSKNQEGATKVTTDGGSGWCSMVATMGVTKGKWYWEAQRSGGSSDSNDVIVGIVGDSDAYIPYSSAAQYYIGNVAESSSMGFYTTGSPNVRNGSGDSLSNSAGDIIMVGLDVDNSKLYFGINGTWDSLGTGGSTIWSSFDNQFIMPAVSVYQGKEIKINFGGYASYTISSANSDADGYGTFEYAVPSGYYALCTKNLEEYG